MCPFGRAVQVHCVRKWEVYRHNWGDSLRRKELGDPGLGNYHFAFDFDRVGGKEALVRRSLANRWPPNIFFPFPKSPHKRVHKFPPISASQVAPVRCSRGFCNSRSFCVMASSRAWRAKACVWNFYIWW